MNNVERSEIPISKAPSGRKPKYNYENPQIKKETEKFSEYLCEKRYATSSIRPYINYVSYFLDWMIKSKLSAPEINYNHILRFIEYCRDDNKGNMLINRMLSAVRNYFWYLGQNKIIMNPAAGVYVKGTRRTVPKDLLEMEELEETYNMYKAIDSRTKRNKVMLGILIHQFPTTEELGMIQTTDVNLQEGLLFIPGNRKSNGRMLELKPFQIMDLQEYVTEIRPEFITGPTRQLFISVNGNKNLKNSLHHMFNALKKINSNIKSPTQIRMSVISHLQKTVPLRKLQYMTGHRHISSTERYKQANTDELYKQLELYHPLNEN